MKDYLPELVSNFTTVPNIVLDELMAELGNAELRVLLALIRKTYGWHKASDKVSLSQLETITGLTRKSVLAGITGLEKYGVVTCERGINGGCNYYTVKAKSSDASIPTPLASELPSIPTPLASAESSVASIPTKESSTKETKELNKKDSSTSVDEPEQQKAELAPEAQSDSDSKASQAKQVPSKKGSKGKEKSSAKKESDDAPETEAQRVLRVAKSYIPLYLYFYEKYTGGKLAYQTAIARNLAEAQVMASDKRLITPKEFEAFMKHIIETGEVKDLIPYTHAFPTFEKLNLKIYQFVDNLRAKGDNNIDSVTQEPHRDFFAGSGLTMQQMIENLNKSDFGKLAEGK